MAGSRQASLDMIGKANHPSQEKKQNDRKVTNTLLICPHIKENQPAEKLLPAPNISEGSHNNPHEGGQNHDEQTQR